MNNNNRKKISTVIKTSEEELEQWFEQQQCCDINAHKLALAALAALALHSKMTLKYQLFLQIGVLTF